MHEMRIIATDDPVAWESANLSVCHAGNCSTHSLDGASSMRLLLRYTVATCLCFLTNCQEYVVGKQDRSDSFCSNDGGGSEQVSESSSADQQKTTTDAYRCQRRRSRAVLYQLSGTYRKKRSTASKLQLHKVTSLSRPFARSSLVTVVGLIRFYRPSRQYWVRTAVIRVCQPFRCPSASRHTGDSRVNGLRYRNYRHLVCTVHMRQFLAIHCVREKVTDI